MRAWRAVLGAPLGSVRYRHHYEVVGETTLATGGSWWVALRQFVIGGVHDGRELILDLSIAEARHLRDRLTKLIEEAESKEESDGTCFPAC